MLRIRPRRTVLACLILVLFSTCLAGADRGEQRPPPSLQTALVEAGASPSASVATLNRIAAGQQNLQQEIRRLHREIAVLRADQTRPGLTEVLGGIGYIIGFFGFYAWFRARRGPV